MQASNESKTEVLTVRDVMLNTGIKARATLDKYISKGVISPIKKPGRQPESYRGKKFLFRKEAVEKLKRYMLTHGRIQPKGLEPVHPEKRVRETRVPRTEKVAPVQAAPELNQEGRQLLAQLEAAIKKVEDLETVVKLLSASLREMHTTH